MPISENDFQINSCSGVASESFQDLNEIQDRIEFFLHESLPQCVKYLPGHGDGSIKRKAEKELAGSLCKLLQAIAFEKKVIFTFFNEDLDTYKKSRTDDMTAIPFVGLAYLRVGPFYYNCQDQLYVIEAKRLPAPTRAGQGDRSREYVVSDWNNCASPTKNRTGGIERFKEGLHGGNFVRSAMIAFVQQKDAAHWLSQVNSWITDLIIKAIPSHKASWNKDDHLIAVPCSPVVGMSDFQSTHVRADKKVPITLRHYWLHLN